MSSQRGEHYERYILPHIAQYSDGVGFLEGFVKGADTTIFFVPLVKAWTWGAMKTLLSPAIPAVLDMARVDRPRFYYSNGVTDLDRAGSMLANSPGWLGTAYVANVVILACFYLLVIRGAYRMGTKGAWMFAICWVVVLITGPVGYAKYRLIMEPLLCAMAGKEN